MLMGVAKFTREDFLSRRKKRLNSSGTRGYSGLRFLSTEGSEVMSDTVAFAGKSALLFDRYSHVIIGETGACCLLDLRDIRRVRGYCLFGRQNLSSPVFR
jgi:hypothetical protein